MNSNLKFLNGSTNNMEKQKSLGYKSPIGKGNQENGFDSNVVEKLKKIGWTMFFVTQFV